MRLEDKILIDRPADQVYRLVSDVERHTELLPGYLESRIISQGEIPCIVQREAIINGQKRRWKSEVSFVRGRALFFHQVEGPLAGMHVSWELFPEGEKTWLAIVHDVDVRPWWKKWWMERWIAKPGIERTARSVLEAIKKSAEREEETR